MVGVQLTLDLRKTSRAFSSHGVGRPHRTSTSRVSGTLSDLSPGFVGGLPLQKQPRQKRVMETECFALAAPAPPPAPPPPGILGSALSNSSLLTAVAVPNPRTCQRPLNLGTGVRGKGLQTLQWGIGLPGSGPAMTSCVHKQRIQAPRPSEEQGVSTRRGTQQDTHAADGWTVRQPLSCCLPPTSTCLCYLQRGTPDWMLPDAQVPEPL